MSNLADFLWATTDVAIWSTVEGGIGITASAAATLRPLFRKFFSSSYGSGTYGTGPSGPWSNGGLGGGYVRSGGGIGGGAVRLRSDIGQGGGTGTVTTIRAKGGDDDEESMVERVRPSMSREAKSSNSNDAGGWGAEPISESDDEWKGGIVKTTRTTQVRD